MESKRQDLKLADDVSLRRGQLGLGTVLFQSMAHIAPALALIFALSAGVAYAGGNLPLSVVIGSIGILAIAYSVGQLARVLPAAGYYMQWTGRAIGPRYGFMAGWGVLMSEALPIGGLYLILGTTFGAFLVPYAHLNIDWIVWVVLVAAGVAALMYFGIKVSARATVILGTLELAIMLLLSLWLIVHSGGRNTLSVFVPGAPGDKTGLVGVFRGMIYVVPAFAGFETAAVLAEESREPRRTIPRAILIATVATALFFVIGAYAGTVAWGPTKMGAYAASPNPWQVLGVGVWGFAGAALVFIALVNSIVGNTVAETTSSTHLMYAMGRIEALPRWFGKVQLRHRTPHHAIFLLTGVGFAVAVVSSLAFGGPTAGFDFSISLGSIVAILLYMSACIAVPCLYLRYQRNEFHVVRHLVIPAIGVLVFIGPLVSSVYPVPPYPLNLVPYIDLVWLLVGGGILFYLVRRRPSVVAKTSAILADEVEGAYVLAGALQQGATEPQASES